MSKMKKSIDKFLSSEEGKILNADIVKLGTTLGIVGAAIAAPDIAFADYIIHNNTFTPAGGSKHQSIQVDIPKRGFPGPDHFEVRYIHGGAYEIAGGAHDSHAAHASHSSHGSHARGGWC